MTNHVALSPERLNAISICTGGGGLDLALNLAIPGARSVCMVEREGFAVARLVEAMEAGLLASAPVWSDARTFRGRPWRGAVDLVFGGIPCQPHSDAGYKRGADDERDLWSPFRRTVVQSGAWAVWIENVGGMLSSGGAERIFRDLRRLGFEVEAGLFTAAECGPTQERERLFILGVANAICGRRYGWSPQPVRRSEARVALEGAGQGSLFPPPPGDLSGWLRLIERSPELEPALRGVPHGLASGMDELRMLGNGVVPVEGAYALRYLATSLALRGSRGAGRLVRMMEP